MTRPPPIRFLAALPLLASLLIPACATPHSDPKWSEGTVEAASERILWEITLIALQKTNFPVGAGMEPAKMIAVSGWQTQLAPFHGEGTREQCEIHFESLEGHKYKIQVRVKKERNDDIHRPLDLTYADWKEEPDDVERARIVLSYIKALLGSEFELKNREVPLVPGKH